jgi:hypothetical protein
MGEEWEYVSLSKRFERFAEHATDPKLAAAYRSLAEQYRTLDQWRQSIKAKYESAGLGRDAKVQPGASTPSPPRRKPA